MPKSKHPVARFCRRLVAARWFQIAVTWFIVISAILVGLDTDPSVGLSSRWWSLLLGAISSLFAVEILIRITAEFPHPLRFFRSAWNVFDFLIVVLGLLPGANKVTLVLRLGRVLRVLRVITAVPGLRIIVSAMLDSLPAVGYVVLLLGLHFYVYGVLGVALFAQNDPGHFGTLSRSMLTLFGVLTLEGWVDVMYTQMLGAAAHPSVIQLPGPGLGLGTISQPAPLAAPIYFVTFILLGTIVIMNLFVGVVINSIQEAHTEAQRTAPPPPEVTTEVPVVPESRPS